MKKIFIVLAILVIPLFSLAAEVTKARIIDYGIYTQDTIKTEKIPDIPTEKRALIDNITFKEMTTRIPTQKDIHFGFRFILEGKPSGTEILIKKKVLHPAITENGKVYTAHEYEFKYTLGEEIVTGYTFGQPYLMVPGEWTIQLFFEGKQLLEQKFTVYKI